MRIEIYQREIQALDELMKNAKVPIAMGMVLGTLRVRIQEAVNKENEKLQKEKYSKK